MARVDWERAVVEKGRCRSKHLMDKLSAPAARAPIQCYIWIALDFSVNANQHRYLPSTLWVALAR